MKNREDFVKLAVDFSEGDSLKIHSGRQAMKLTPGNIENFYGKRGLRGRKLPRGYQKVDRIEIIRELPEGPTE